MLQNVSPPDWSERGPPDGARVSLQALLKDPVADPPSKYTKGQKGLSFYPPWKNLSLKMAICSLCAIYA